MIKKFDEFLNEGLSASEKKDLDKAWNNYMQSDIFSNAAQKKSDLQGYIKGRTSSEIDFDNLCAELEELGWTENDIVNAGTELDYYWKEKAKEELSKM